MFNWVPLGSNYASGNILCKAIKSETLNLTGLKYVHEVTYIQKMKFHTTNWATARRLKHRNECMSG